MNCPLCSNSFSPEHQSPACPHLNQDPPKPRACGPRLRPEIQRELDDAFKLRDQTSLIGWTESPNFAARFYAKFLLDRIAELDKEEKLRSDT